MSLGPIMLDVQGTALTHGERELLKHPAAAGVILFTRNFASVDQLAELVRDIKSVRNPPLLVAVDHEGGRVQRFREGFSRLPPARSYGRLYDLDPEQGCRHAQLGGWLMAAELRAVGIDFSFAPVADLDYGRSEVIGDRAFHHQPEAAGLLARHYLRGMRDAGMSGVVKHFPGHGAVAADSHLSLPVDERPLDDIRTRDMEPFRALIAEGVTAVMPAHIVFVAADNKPAGYSSYWLKTVLREQLGFQGVIVSDDLGMLGAAVLGDFATRAAGALEAGCDMLLVCNDPGGAESALQALAPQAARTDQRRLKRLYATGTSPDWRKLRETRHWREAVDAVSALS